MAPRPTRRAAGRFLVTFGLSAAGYMIVYYLLFDLYAVIVFAMAKTALFLSNPHLHQVVMNPGVSAAIFQFAESADLYAVTYTPYFVYVNLVFTLALVASMPSFPLPAKLKKSLWALLILMLVHAFQTFVDLAYASSTIQPASQWIPYSPLFIRALFEIQRFYSHMGQYVLPFLLWLFLFRERILALARPGPVGNQLGVSRNAPCPCGSGKKYKICCGRQQT